MEFDQNMYHWRRMTPQEREEALRERQHRQLPWHGPPHFEDAAEVYLVTAACFEHKPIIGMSPARMVQFETNLLTTIQVACDQVFAWIILPNHYHFLARTPKVKSLLKDVGKLHGRTSFLWNGEDEKRGRQVWHRAAETAMKSEAHFWAALNYVLNNAVRHGYVDRWQDWASSNAAEYLAESGRDEALRRWQTYPVLDFGKDWDPPEL